jgi:hypothetical protein
MARTRFDDVKEGDTLIADEHFECLSAGAHVVRSGTAGLYVSCLRGHHDLDGQIDQDGYLVGLQKPDASKAEDV